jgi:hypothetical protein
MFIYEFCFYIKNVYIQNLFKFENCSYFEFVHIWKMFMYEKCSYMKNEKGMKIWKQKTENEVLDAARALHRVNRRWRGHPSYFPEPQAPRMRVHERRHAASNSQAAWLLPGHLWTPASIESSVLREVEEGSTWRGLRCVHGPIQKARLPC